MSNGYFQSPCRKRVTTRPADLDQNDLLIDVTASPGEDPGTFDISVTISAKNTFGDIQSIVGVDDVYLFDQTTGEPEPVGETTSEVDEGVLSISSVGVEQTESNVTSIWKVLLEGLEVVTKDGATHTIPAVTKTFSSPL